MGSQAEKLGCVSGLDSVSQACKDGKYVMTMMVVLMLMMVLMTVTKREPDLMNPGPRVLLLPGIERPDINSKLYLLSSTY